MSDVRIKIGDMLFEWDSDKYNSNLQKHGISFNDAVYVFNDDNLLLKPDPDHSVEEERFVVIGFNRKSHLLTVCHCYKEDGEVTRIISARRATRNELLLYWEESSLS
jgi:hypothetical protein